MHQFFGVALEDLITRFSMKNPQTRIQTVNLRFGSQKKTRNRAFIKRS